MIRVTTRSTGHIGQLMFAFVPLFALWLKLLYWNRKRFYTEHLVLALHLHAFGFLVMLGAQLRLKYATETVIVIAVAYLLIALQRVFGGAIWTNLVRGLLVFCIHGFTMLLAVSALIIWAVMT